MKEDDILYVGHILDAIDRIGTYLDGSAMESFGDWILHSVQDDR